jgi:hypothetical protein
MESCILYKADLVRPQHGRNCFEVVVEATGAESDGITVATHWSGWRLNVGSQGMSSTQGAYEASIL